MNIDKLQKRIADYKNKGAKQIIKNDTMVGNTKRKIRDLMCRKNYTAEEMGTFTRGKAGTYKEDNRGNTLYYSYGELIGIEDKNGNTFSIEAQADDSMTTKKHLSAVGVDKKRENE